ncbi:MAG TPA: DUF4133 domain-containing protein [Puia sp.]|jgi:hypothetical protein
MIERKIYPVNRGVNRSLEFRGLKAQYVWWLAAVVVGDMIGFGVLRLAGLNLYGCVLIILGLGGLGITRVYALSRKYGRYGLMKRKARRALPAGLLCKSRKVFIQLYSDEVRTNGGTAAGSGSGRRPGGQ